MSSLERAKMRLAASVDGAYTRIDRIELEVESLKEQQAATADRLDGITSRLDSMDRKPDLILTRPKER
jgi:chaperonin cofactor prefoldin